MGITIYEGKESGLFDWRFPLVVNRWDPSREIKTHERVGETGLRYLAFLPQWGVTVEYEGKMWETAKVTLEGKTGAVDRFREMVLREHSQLVEDIS